MASQSALRNAEWDVVQLLWEHGPSPVSCVFRRARNAWEPWVIVAESAIMRRAGRRGLGLYDARALRKALAGMMVTLSETLQAEKRHWLLHNAEGL
jgi:hypothetical protein